MSKKMCLFAHFDRNNRVAPYVVRYVKAISAIGFDVVFISSSKLGEIELAPLRQECSDIILRDNLGHDFGSWAAGFRSHEVHIKGELLLANDSVFGPIGDLGPAVDRLRGLSAGMAGFVESAARVPHLQSWFLLLQPDVYRSSAFQDVLLQNFAGRPKTDIIKSGEIGLSVAVREMGFRVAGLFSDVNFVFTGQPFNPMMLVWRELIEEVGCPFIKIELLRDNPCGIPGLGTWREVVSKQAPEMMAMIESHLTQLTGHPEANIAKGARLLPSLLHYWGWYRRAFRLKTSALQLQRLHALLFKTLWRVQPIVPQVRYLKARAKNAVLAVKYMMLPVNQLIP